MAAIPGGVPITGFISPTDTTDTYPVIDPSYGIDGYRSEATTTTRNAIPDGRRRWGMEVYTQTEAKLWRLNEGPWAGDDTDWTELTSGGGGSPSAPDRSIQFNDSGSFGGSAGLTYYPVTYFALNVDESITTGLADGLTGINCEVSLDAALTSDNDIYGQIIQSGIGHDDVIVNGSFYGQYISVSISGAGTTAIDGDIYGAYIETFNNANNTVTGDMYVVYLDGNNGGGATLDNFYGIFIEDIAGATNNYAIKTGTGLVEFGDIMKTANKIYPGTDAAALQTAAGLYANTGAPNNANGANGDFYFRADGGAATTIYQRRAGTWVGVV